MKIKSSLSYQELTSNFLKLKSDPKEFPYLFGTDQSDRDVVAANHKGYLDAVNVHKDHKRKFTSIGALAKALSELAAATSISRTSLRKVERSKTPSMKVGKTLRKAGRSLRYLSLVLIGS